MLPSEYAGAARAFLRLPGRPDQVTYARRWISGELGRDHALHDDCLLLASEIATNAILHSETGAGGAFTLSLSYSDRWLLVRVEDEGSADPPYASHAAPSASGGRGLQLVEALACRWGIIREAGINQVWFELVTAAIPIGTVNGGSPGARGVKAI